jgi:hypothetical protein
VPFRQDPPDLCDTDRDGICHAGAAPRRILPGRAQSGTAIAHLHHDVADDDIVVDILTSVEGLEQAGSSMPRLARPMISHSTAA